MSTPSNDLADYLRPTWFIDSDHPDVSAFAEEAVGEETGTAARARALYYAVRDGIRYDTYEIDLSDDSMRASAVLARGIGFCIPKAVLLAAAARAQGIASRLGFADVKNHLPTERLLEVMEDDVLVYHGYVDLFIEDEWVRATPAFNRSLCERLSVDPLEFDGRHDALLQQFDRAGNKYLEYVHDRGVFADLPLDQIRAGIKKHHPALFAAAIRQELSPGA
jgi:transglutaminase-like putative cysteine protease